MKNLYDLNDKIIYELNETKKPEEYENVETEKDSKSGYLGIRHSDSRKIVGRVNKDFDWQIDYDVLRKAICDDVITVDLNKTKKLFKLFKDYINDKEKFESKYK